MKGVIGRLKNKFSLSIDPLPSLNFLSHEKLLKRNWFLCRSLLVASTYSFMCRLLMATRAFKWVSVTSWLFFITMSTAWACKYEDIFWLGILLELQFYQRGRSYDIINVAFILILDFTTIFNFFVFWCKGHGRSVAVMCALLVALGITEDWKTAEKLIKQKRPYIRMNALHRKALEEWSRHRLSAPKK